MYKRQLVSQCDFITLHIPATADTKGMVNASLISQMKHGVRILNFARGELVCNSDLAAALKTGRVGSYVCDFPSEELLGLEGCVCLPHLGASTPESEENCAMMASQELSDYLLDGNIRNSVNFPTVSMPVSYTHLDVYKRQTQNPSTLLKLHSDAVVVIDKELADAVGYKG